MATLADILLQKSGVSAEIDSVKRTAAMAYTVIILLLLLILFRTWRR